MKNLWNYLLKLLTKSKVTTKKTVKVRPGYLSRFFSLNEMIRSQTATRHNLKNVPNKFQIENLKALCLNILDPIRVKFGPTYVSSGFRQPEVNKLDRGYYKSQHMKAEAGDIENFTVSNIDLWKWIVLESGLDFDQVIAEFVGEGGNAGWIHVSYKRTGQNRNKISIAKKIKGKTRYFHYTLEQIKAGKYKF